MHVTKGRSAGIGHLDPQLPPYSEIAGYADKVSGVAKASNLVKKGTYIGTALDVAATGLSIHKACTMGREEQCRRAKYVESSALIGGLGGGSIGGGCGRYGRNWCLCSRSGG